MNIYICTDFEGHYPVGTSAVIVAESKREAEALLAEELKKYRLNSTDFTLKLLDTSAAKALILQDGDY